MAGFVIPVSLAAIDAIPVLNGPLQPSLPDSPTLAGPASPFAQAVEHAMLDETERSFAANASLASKPPEANDVDQDDEDDPDAPLVTATIPIQLAAQAPTRWFDWSATNFPRASSSSSDDATSPTSNATDGYVVPPPPTAPPNAMPLDTGAAPDLAHEPPAPPPPTTDAQQQQHSTPLTDSRDATEFASARPAIDVFSLRIVDRSLSPVESESQKPQPDAPASSRIQTLPEEAPNAKANALEAPKRQPLMPRNAAPLALHSPNAPHMASNSSGMQFGPGTGDDHANPQADFPLKPAEHSRMQADQPVPHALASDDPASDRPAPPLKPSASTAPAPPLDASQPRLVAPAESPAKTVALPPLDTNRHLDKAMELQSPATHLPVATSSVNSLRLQLTTPAGHSINLRIREHQGALRIDTRSSDAGVATELRSDVPRLIESLHASGFGAEIEAPAHTAERAAFSGDGFGDSTDSPDRRTFAGDGDQGRQGRRRGQQRDRQGRQANDFE